MWLRHELPVQRIRTIGFSDSLFKGARYPAARCDARVWLRLI
jgi:hypothetical protein